MTQDIHSSCTNLRKSTKRPKQNNGNLFLQFIATISGCLAVMGFGMTIGWSSPALPHLRSADSKIPISVGQGAWVTSIANFGNVLGLLLVPQTMNQLGRKYTILLHGIFQVLSWICIIFAKNFATLCIARIIAGYGTSGSLAVVSIYLGEITEKKIRGMLSSLIVVFSDFGIFVVASLGAYFPYNTMNILLLFIPIIHVVTFVFMPESPYLYLMRDQDEKAVICLKKLRGVEEAAGIELEIEEMRMAVNEIKGAQKNSLRNLLSSRSSRKAFLIVLLASFSSLSSGSTALIAYCQTIFSYSGFSLNPAHSFMIIIAVKIITGFIVCQFIEKVERRTLFLLSGVSCAIAQCVVGLFFFIKYHTEFDISLISWLPLVSLVSFHITAAIGIGPIPYILMAELFSLKIKQVAVPAIVIFSTFVSFWTELMFPLIGEGSGNFFSFWIFAACSFFGTAVSFYIMPKTKNKSLEEIQTILRSKN